MVGDLTGGASACHCLSLLTSVKRRCIINGTSEFREANSRTCGLVLEEEKVVLEVMMLRRRLIGYDDIGVGDR